FKIMMISRKPCQMKPFYIHCGYRLCLPIQEHGLSFIKERLYPTLFFVGVDVDQVCQLWPKSAGKILLKRYGVIVAVDKLIGNHHIPYLIVRDGPCHSQVKHLTGALLVKGIQNNLHIIAVGIASDYYLMLDRRMREEINIHS